MGGFMNASRAFARRLVVPALLCFFFALPARSAELADLFTETSQPSGDFLSVLTQIRDLLNTSGAAQGGARCSENVVAEARLAVPRSLSSGVSTANATTDNEYFTRDISAGGLTGNQCAVNFNAMWMKGAKGGTAGSVGMVRVMMTMTCPCTAGAGSLKTGSLSFSVPVNTVTVNDVVSHRIGVASNFVVEAECCNGRKEPKSYLDLNGALIGVIRDPSTPKPPSPAQPPRTATQPYTSPPPAPPPKPAAPVPKAEPAWSVENPCPECENWRVHYLKAQAAAEAAQKTIEEIERQLRENQAKQDQAKAKVAQLTRELSRQQGTGGKATDPDTGHTIDAWTQADGKVKITERDADGNVVREETRERRDSAKIRADIEKEQAKLKELEAARGQLEKDLDYATKLKAKHLKHAADLLAGLRECIEEKCNKPRQVSCVMPPSQAIVIGPKERFGPESTASSVASGLLGSALGSLTGGRFSTGGSDAGGSGPDLKSDPVKDKQVFTDPTTGTRVAVGSIIKDGRLLTSVKVEDAKEGEPVIHQMYRQRLVPQVPDAKAPNEPPACKVETQEPIGWEPYGIWEAWWSKLRIQVWKSTDGGPWVKTKDTGWMDWGSGVNLTGVMSAEDIPKTAWGSMGGQRPVGAPRAAGAGFEWTGKYVYPDQPAPERMVLHLAQPWKDPVTTTTMDLYPTYSKTGTVQYSDKAPEFKWDYKPRPGGGMQDIDRPDLGGTRMPTPGGGMQRIDPPAGTPDMPEESILDSFEYKTHPM
jgi:hypothetical protein